MITFRDQIILIIYFSLFGMFLAVMYDILNFYLNKFKVRLIIGYIIQLVYWIGLVVLACLFMLKVSDGYLTIYTFGFFLLGILIHFYFFSKGFYEDLNRADRWMTKLYNRCKKVFIVIVFPKEVYMVIRRIIPSKKTIKKIIKFFKKIGRLFKKKKKKKKQSEEIDNRSIYEKNISTNNNNDSRVVY